MKKFLLTLSFFVCLVVSLFPEDNSVKFEQISVEQGLSQSVVLCILQDSEGFMWFGTHDGLNRYDGYKFTVYMHDPNNPHSLSNNSVTAIYEDREGNIWIGTEGGGLNRLDRERKEFNHYETDLSNPHSLSHNFVTTIYEDSFGYLWIGTQDGGLNRLTLSDNEASPPAFFRYRTDPNNPSSLGGDSISAIYEDRSGNLWIGSHRGGLNLYNREKDTFVRFQHDPENPQSLNGNEVFSIYEDRLGQLWIGTECGLNKLVWDDKKESLPNFIHYQIDSSNPNSLSKHLIYAICEDNSGCLWIGTYGGGLNRFIPSDNEESSPTLIRYQHDANNPDSLSHDDVISLCKDRSGLIWVGTSGGGLNKLIQTKEKFLHYKSPPGDPKSTNHDFVFSICEDSTGAVWIGTREGLSQINREKGKFFQCLDDSSIPEELKSHLIRFVHEDRSGLLWFGTEGAGIFKCDPKNGSFTHYQNEPKNPNSLSSNMVISILEDQDGFLWIATSGEGVNKFDPASEHFTHYKSNADDPNSLSDNSIRCIYEDREGVIWIGTHTGGLNKFDREKEIFTYYKCDPETPKSLSNNHVISIHESKTGILWIGTAGGGLNKFDRENKAFFCFLEKDGLPNNTIYGILEDDSGNLWLSTNKGVSKFNPGTETFRNYNVSDGLQSSEFNGGAYYKSRSGEMFFGGINGLNTFFPDKIKDNPYIPQILITDFRIFNKSVKVGDDSPLEKPITETEKITLSHNNNVFSFEFVALDYTNPKKNQYAYMMEGYDKDWIYLGNQRHVTFQNLDPGKYVFRVKGSNNDGVWNEDGTSIEIVISPPFWRTWKFVLFVTLLFIGLVFFGNRMRKRFLPIRVELDPDMSPIVQKYQISKREQEIISLILKGKSYKDIAGELFISIKTVKSHVYNVYQKLKIKNRMQLLNIFINNSRKSK